MPGKWNPRFKLKSKFKRNRQSDKQLSRVRKLEKEFPKATSGEVRKGRLSDQAYKRVRKQLLKKYPKELKQGG